MKASKLMWKILSVLCACFLLTGCGTNGLQPSSNNSSTDSSFVSSLVSSLDSSSNLSSITNSSSSSDSSLDSVLKLKSSGHFTIPLCDDNDINKGIVISKDNKACDEVIRELMTSLFERYKGLSNVETGIKDYKLKKTDIVLQTNEGCVFGVLFSVQGGATRTRWDANEQDDGWTPTKIIYCSYYEHGGKYVLNIIGQNPFYYNGNHKSMEEIAKILFEKQYLLPRTLDDKNETKLLSYNIDKVSPQSDNKDNLGFLLSYSIQGVKGECCWSIVQSDGSGSGALEKRLIPHGDFYEIS